MDHTPYPHTVLQCSASALHCTALYCTHCTVLLMQQYYAAVMCYAAPHWLHCWFNTSAAAIAEEELWRTVLNPSQKLLVINM